MDTNFSPVLGRAESVHAYHVVPSSDKKAPSKAEEPANLPAPLLPPRLQSARLTTQETVKPFFEKVKFALKDVDPLKKSRFSPGATVGPTQLVQLAQKIAEIKDQGLLVPILGETHSEYLQTCWKNLKGQFDQFYFKIIQDHGIINRAS